MMSYVIKNVNTGELAPSMKVYRTERGSEMGKRALIERLLQDEYLNNDGLDYNVFLAWCDEMDPNNSIMTILGQRPPVCREDTEVLHKRVAELNDEWQIVPATITT